MQLSLSKISSNQVAGCKNRAAQRPGESARVWEQLEGPKLPAMQEMDNHRRIPPDLPAPMLPTVPGSGG